MNQNKSWLVCLYMCLHSCNYFSFRRHYWSTNGFFAQVDWILKETDPRTSCSQLVQHCLSHHLQQFEQVRNASITHLWTRRGELTLPMLEDQLLKITNDGNLKCITWDHHKSTKNLHFQHPVCMKQGFLQLQQPKREYGADWTWCKRYRENKLNCSIMTLYMSLLNNLWCTLLLCVMCVTCPPFLWKHALYQTAPWCLNCSMVHWLLYKFNFLVSHKAA